MNKAHANLGFSHTLFALIVGQIALHGCMTGVRVAAPLQALSEGRAPWAVGVLIALFAIAPLFVALYAGRLVARSGYHKSLQLAVFLAMLGGLTAAISTFAGAGSFALLSGAAILLGAGANVGLIATQYRVARSAQDSIESVKMFSWYGVTLPLASVAGSVIAGFMIDISGFRAAFALLMLMPLATIWTARHVPHETPRRPSTALEAQHTALDLLRKPQLRQMLIVNWLVMACGDVNSFAVPILGHERGFSASTIGLILGVFPLGLIAMRLALPVFAYRVRAPQVLKWTMVGSCVVCASFPLVYSPWLMAGSVFALGVALGAAQPTIMSLLHRATPDHRHGEVLALRSMTLNLSSTIMPLLFGVASTALGVGPVFWAMGSLAGGVGSWAVYKLRLIIKSIEA